MFRGLFSQIIVIALGIAIIFLYIEPLLGEIGDTQDETAVYRTNKEKVQSVNAKLAGLNQQINNIPVTERTALQTYVPDIETVDIIAIPRDIEFIMNAAGVSYEQVDMPEIDLLGENTGGDSTNATEPWIQAHSITVNFTGAYDEVKRFLDLLSTNESPLVMTELQIEPANDGDILRASGIINTYSYSASAN